MTLDLEQVARHLPQIVETVRAEYAARDQRWQAAFDALRVAASDIALFTQRVHDAGTQRTLALPLADPPDETYDVAPLRSYTVLGVDGSHIQPQRDSPAHCSVMNFGWCRVSYREGYPPDLRAETQVDIASADQWSDEERDSFFSADAIGVARAVREVEVAARLANELPPDLPAVVLLDGSLAPWSLNRLSRGSKKRDEMLRRLFGAFDELQSWVESGAQRVMAAYTSFPAHREIIDSLKAARQTDAPELDTRLDRSLFGPMLKVGDRSARFLMYSRREGWLEQEFKDARHSITYCYLRTNSEVARIEMPEWIGRDDERVQLLHSALLDQVERGIGYPLALMEAHERAVINGADRQAFTILVESALEAGGLVSFGSAKNLSKRGRWLA